MKSLILPKHFDLVLIIIKLMNGVGRGYQQDYNKVTLLQ